MKLIKSIYYTLLVLGMVLLVCWQRRKEEKLNVDFEDLING